MPPRAAPNRAAETVERAPRRRWRPRWQGLARVAIIAGLTLFISILSVGIRERGEPVAARVVDRADRDAIFEVAGGEWRELSGGQENFTLSYGRQLGYKDGSSRFVEGIELTVSEQVDRDGFNLTGTEAEVNDAETDVTVIGDVQLTVSTGLVVHTDTATYGSEPGVVTMHDDAGPTTLTRSGLDASGRHVEYARDRGVVVLRESAWVRLNGDDDRVAVDIRSTRASLADADRYMHFEGGVEVLTGTMVLESDTTTAHFGEAEDALERLELRGSAGIRATDPGAGGLREMGSREMTLTFEETTRTLDQVMLAGASAITLNGSDGERGARITAAAIDVAMTPDGDDVEGLVARDGVWVGLPITPDGALQVITAVTLTSPADPEPEETGTTETGLTSVRFDEQVEFHEERPATPTASAATRVIRAERLAAGVEDGLSALLEARFLGNVRFDDETRQGTADEAVYDVSAGLVTLSAVGSAGQTPTLTEPATSRLEAPSIELAVDGSTVSASGGVESVLTPQTDDTANSTSSTLPALLDDDQQVMVTAETFHYDGDAGQATYTGAANLWQGSTRVQADSLALNDQTGNLTASGDVRTNIQLMRLDETTQTVEPSQTRVRADSFTYDEATRHAVYDGKALLRSDHGDLEADTIDVFLEADGRTLDRLAATGNVQLLLDGRWATGERLVYHEADGRYELEGAPVKIVEEMEPEPEDTAVTPPPRPGTTPPPPTCRSTEGLTATFYRSTDTVTVDGREERRTQTITGACSPPTPSSAMQAPHTALTKVGGGVYQSPATRGLDIFPHRPKRVSPVTMPPVEDV